jgi:hypothetical protein
MAIQISATITTNEGFVVDSAFAFLNIYLLNDNWVNISYYKSENDTIKHILTLLGYSNIDKIESIQPTLEDATTNFRCDITLSIQLTKDESSKINIIIENQLNNSDHDHLGKLLTYYSYYKDIEGKKPNIAIWRAPYFKEEHLKAINFLNDVSTKLKINKKIKHFPVLFSLMLWSSKKNLLTQKEKYKNSSFRIGRGILFHICPSNVPLNFFYSFAFGLLSGNANIIKIPTKKFEETEILLKIIKTIINKKIYRKIKATNNFIRYEKNKLVNDYFSSFSDGRIIWGSDKTVSEIK